MERFQTLLSNLTCAAIQWRHRALARSAPPPRRAVRKLPENNCQTEPKPVGPWQGLLIVPYPASLKHLRGIEVLYVGTGITLLKLNSVSGLVLKIWYLIPFDQSELCISSIPPTDPPPVRPGRDPWVNRPSISRRSEGLVPPTLRLS